MPDLHGDLSGWTLAPIALAPFLLSLTAFTDAEGGPAAREAGPPPSEVYRMEARAAVISRGLTMAEDFYAAEVAPIERILRPFTSDQRWARHIAVALVREGRNTGVDPRVLASVVAVENPWLDPDISSPQGAVGLMQVMPFHAGAWGCGSEDLEDPDVNICYGARIFQSYLTRAGGDVDRALLAYNGCVRGTNTPDCHLYPRHVYARAGRAMVRGWLEAN